MLGVSICIVTYQAYFWIRLAVEKIREYTQLIPYEILVYDNGSTDKSVDWLEKQDDVTLFKSGNIGHGPGLDFLVRNANMSYCCTLDCDVHPMSSQWITPVFDLCDGATLVGVRRGFGHKLDDYIHPSFLVSSTSWLRERSFVHDWPTYDTGERLTEDALRCGGLIRSVDMNYETFDGKINPKACIYGDNMLWHTWWSVRKKVDVASHGEFEQDYHEMVMSMFREKYRLEY